MSVAPRHNFRIGLAVPDSPPTPRFPIEQLKVASFRGLKDLELRQLQRINFLVGSGNSGKTSVLEAIGALASPLDMRDWLHVARYREARENRFYPLRAVDVLRWLFPHDVTSDGEDRHGPIAISAAGSTPVITLKARCDAYYGTRKIDRADLSDDEPDQAGDEDVGMVEDDGWRFQIEAQVAARGQWDRLNFIGWNTTAAALPSRSEPKLRCHMLSPYAHRSQPAQLKGLTRATIEDRKAGTVALLRELDPKILGVEIISDPNGERALLALRHKTSGVAPIHVFGDGLRRALMIAMAIQNCEGGVLLLDEFEAALHVSALSKVFSWLERACEAYDVQVIGTTHSLEAIDAVAGCMESESVAAYHISGPDGETKRYSKDMLLRLVHERGLDIR